MNALPIISRLLGGIALGFFFYAGLWLTVREISTTRHPVLLTLGSFWIRALVVVSGFLFLMNGRWDFALICMAGFMVGKVAVSKSLQAPTARTRCL